MYILSVLFSRILNWFYDKNSILNGLGSKFNTSGLKQAWPQIPWIFFYSLHSSINVVLIIQQNAHVIWPIKRDIQSSNSLLCKHVSIHLYHHVYSMRVRYSVKPASIYKFILDTNKRYLVFVTASFDLDITFSTMLSIFELYQKTMLVPCLHTRHFLVLYLTYSSKSGIHIPCAH
jgi:hypothetical protein